MGGLVVGVVVQGGVVVGGVAEDFHDVDFGAAFVGGVVGALGGVEPEGGEHAGAGVAVAGADFDVAVVDLEQVGVGDEEAA